MRIMTSALIIASLSITQPAWAAGDQSGIITWQTYFQQLLSSLKIDASQTNTSGQQVLSTAKSSSEAKITSVLQNRVSMKIAEAKSRYSYETGQGYNACMVTVGISDIAKAKQERVEYARKVGTRDSEWLSEGGGRTEDTLSSIVALRKEVYCSDQEKADLGSYCHTTHNGYDAGNTDASVWLAHRGYGGEEAMTGFDYVDTVAPLPTVPEKSPDSSEKAMERAEAISAGVMRNAARTTLQNIILDGLSGTSATE